MYGRDMRGFPIRNLIRHKRRIPRPPAVPAEHIDPDQPAQGSDQYGAAGDNDDYQLRLARTPIPTFLAEVLETHLAKIYSDEVDRDTSDEGIEDWWKRRGRQGTSIDRWMADTIAPILLALGQLDIIFDHPATTEDVKTRADVQRLGLDTCVAGYILARQHGLVEDRPPRAGTSSASSARSPITIGASRTAADCESTFTASCTATGTTRAGGSTTATAS